MGLDWKTRRIQPSDLKQGICNIHDSDKKNDVIRDSDKYFCESEVRM